MNWEKVKSFLIVLFLCINILLVITTVRSIRTATSVSFETITDTAALLENNGIAINPDIIPRSVDNIDNIDLTNVVFCEGELSNPATDSAQFTHSLSTGTVTLGNAKDEAKKAARALGLAHAVPGDAVQLDDGSIAVDLHQRIDHFEVFDSEVRIVFSDKTANVSGVWYLPETMPHKSGGAREMMYITGVLIEFIGNPDRAPQLQVSGIAFGYRIPPYESGVAHKQMTAVPCYRITASDGSRYDYDAKTGEYLGQG